MDRVARAIDRGKLGVWMLVPERVPTDVCSMRCVVEACLSQTQDALQWGQVDGTDAGWSSIGRLLCGLCIGLAGDSDQLKAAVV